MFRAPARVLLILAALFLGTSALAQTAGRGGTPGGGVLVHVEEPGGGPIQVSATVTLSSTDSPEGLTVETRGGGVATFRAVPVGDYAVEVSAPGYETVRDSVMVMSSSTAASIYVTLRVRGSAPNAQPGTQTPLLTGKARKELDAAIAALQHGKAADAGHHVDYALKHAPGDPNVQYIAAEYFLRVSETENARIHFETAVKIYPDHAAAQVELGSLLLQQLNNPADAIPHLERALSADATLWRAHWLLAEAYLLTRQQIDRAEVHARRAMEFGKDKAAGAAITLAYAQAMSGDKPTARATLTKYLSDFPADAAAPRARALLASQELSEPLPSAVASLPLPRSDSGDLAGIGRAATSRAWLPHGVDDAIPAVSATETCELPEVLQAAGKRSGEFAVAFERFAATENFTHDELDDGGAVRHSSEGTFDYVAFVEHPTADRVSVREVRAGSSPRATHADPVTSEGIPAIGLLFNPMYARDFDFSCEGLSQWRGQSAWQVHFAQRGDRESRMLGWVANGKSYPALLKGRAWISASSYRILRLDAELMNPLPQIRLDYEHIAIDYAPVKFREGREELWLPAYAEVYRHFRGKYFREEHRFSNFLLFRVETRQKAEAPGQP
ncbi:MAG TPA: tetratricopeptide repeat protein [Candidatus Acidoferrales bacterium]|nr:tetratricopeptide repeat protein [Candidatus Acidoferrales bacterium]